MKKITLFLVALLVSMTTFAANLLGGTTVYLKPSGDWNQANARFAIYCWDDAAGEAWYDMKVTPNNPIIYSVTIPTGKDFTGFKFVRMNPATTENNWDNKWNETGNLTYDAAKTQYNVSGWDKGSWGEYTTPEKCTLTLVGDNTTLFGSAWSTDKTENDMTYSQSSKKWTKVYTLDLTGNLTGNYKVAYNHAWDYSWSNGDGNDGNTKLNLAISGEGKYRVTFTFDPATKQLSATIKKLIITIVEGTELYIQVPTTFTIASATTTFGKATSGNALGGASPITMTEVDETNQIWKVVAPAGTQDSLFSVLLTDSEGALLKVTDLKYDKVNNLFVLSEEVTFGTSRKPGSATEANGTWSVYQEEIVEPEQPEVKYTIVEGTKLYVQTPFEESVSASRPHKVVFGNFTVPTGGGTGGSLRPMAASTVTEVEMTKVYTEAGQYNIWEVTAPAGTQDSIFNVIVYKQANPYAYIVSLKYDGEKNLFKLPNDYKIQTNKNGIIPATEADGEWDIYVPDYSGGDATNVENATSTNIFVQDGRIVAEGEYQIYTITGQNVTGMNGSLENGVYVVKSANAAVKVIVK